MHAKSNKPEFVDNTYIRTQLTRQKSEMYRKEVPLFGNLLEIIENINKLTEQLRPGTLESRGLSQERLTEERHGAIRLATNEELRGMAKRFEICGMQPVDYYDLTVAGMPAHSTAFRPIEKQQLAENPYRVFTSVLKLDALKEKIANKIISTAESPEESQGIIDSKWAKIEEVISNRKIFTDRSEELVKTYEKQGGFTKEQADEFVKELLETFRWQKTAAIEKPLYDELKDLSAIVADVIGFKVPHINHLTPVTLDIDAAYGEMKNQNMQVISAIQGPPKRDVPILLRQTSFTALTEDSNFPKADGGSEKGFHKARFGEIEQRGVALTPKGRRMYDLLLDAAMQYAPSEKAENYKDRYPEVLAKVFESFPDSDLELRKEGLAYYSYQPTKEGKEAAKQGKINTTDTEELIKLGYAKAIPITYEDFLPFSAVGIFKSNLGDMAATTGQNYTDQKIDELKPNLEATLKADLEQHFDRNGKRLKQEQKTSGKQEFEKSLGREVIDPFKLYEALQAKSLKKLYQDLELWRKVPVNENVKIRNAIENDPVKKLNNETSVA